MQEGEHECVLLVVDVEQDEAEQDSQHCGKDEARSIVGNIAQVALPEPAEKNTPTCQSGWRRGIHIAIE